MINVLFLRRRCLAKYGKELVFKIGFSFFRGMEGARDILVLFTLNKYF